MGGRLKNTYIGSSSQIASGIGGTWAILGSSTLTAEASSIAFTGLSGYTTYMLLIYTIDSNNAGGHTVGIRCNADTGTNYRDTWIKSDGTNVTTGKHDAAASPTYVYCTAVGQNERSYTTAWVSNSAATQYKPVIAFGGQTNYQTLTTSGQWVNNTDSITGVSVVSTANMEVGSKVILLGSA